MGTTVSFGGALVEASPAILEAFKKKANPPPNPKDDLHALARTVFRKLYSPPPEALPTIQNYYKDEDGFLKKVSNFWSSVSSAWSKIFELADKSDVNDSSTYFEFATELVKQLPFKTQ